jgi:hypothetical protein
MDIWFVGLWLLICLAANAAAAPKTGMAKAVVAPEAAITVTGRLVRVMAIGGETTGIPMPGMRHADLTGADEAIDRTDRVLVMRYPSRRAFLELISDPRYLRWAPYKFAALELALLPVTARAVIPDLRWIVGWVSLSTLLATGWILAARKAASGQG